MVISVGIDVSKDKHDCFIVSSEGEVLADVFTIPNNMDGFHCLLQKIQACAAPQDKIKVGLEATGHYSYNLSTCFGSLSFIHHKEEKIIMKLKKIASLALAGIMAVSMLAGCSTTSVEPTPTPDPDPEQPNVSGYSQMLYNHLGYTAKKKVEPQDSNDVNDALATAMEYAAGNTIANSYDWFIDGDTHVVNKHWAYWNRVPDSLKNGANALISELGAENVINQNLTQTFDVLDPTNDNYNRDDMNISMLFVADGFKGMEAVMDEVADMINRRVELLEDDFDLPDNLVDVGGHSMNTDYDYTMSVAADTITLTADHGKSLTFVAVNIARV